MRYRRSERLIGMTKYILERPRELITLTYFANLYGAAKSSISDDVRIIKKMFEHEGIGKIETVSGASGGIRYIVTAEDEDVKSLINNLCELIANPERLLPGGYLFMLDILGDPNTVNKIGRIFAAAYKDKEIDVVMTIETKGIPLAYAVAAALNVPVVIVRSDSKVTEGSTVSINYVSGSTKSIRTMVLAKRSLQEDSNVLIVDDFMKAGGTVNGMINLLAEFKANLAGIAVLVEAENVEERLIEDEYISLMKLSNVDVRNKTISVHEGNYLKKHRE